MLEKLLKISEDVDKALAPFADITDDVWLSAQAEPSRILRQDESAVAVALGGDDLADKNGAMIAQLPAAVQTLRAISDRLKAEIAELGPLRGKLTPDTKISGKRFEEFYRDTFPAGWVLEDLPYEASDDRDVWVMDPDREESFAWFGYAERNGDPTPNAGPRLAALEKSTQKRQTVELSELYEAVYEDQRNANEATIPDVSFTTQIEDWRDPEGVSGDELPVSPALPVQVAASATSVDVFIGGAKEDPYGKDASSVRIEREGTTTRFMVYDGINEVPLIIEAPHGESLLCNEGSQTSKGEYILRLNSLEALTLARLSYHNISGFGLKYVFSRILRKLGIDRNTLTPIQCESDQKLYIIERDDGDVIQDCSDAELQFGSHAGILARMEKEISFLRVAVTRYCDKTRMGTIKPMEVQQAVDRAFTDEPV